MGAMWFALTIVVWKGQTVESIGCLQKLSQIDWLPHPTLRCPTLDVIQIYNSLTDARFHGGQLNSQPCAIRKIRVWWFGIKIFNGFLWTWISAYGLTGGLTQERTRGLKVAVGKKKWRRGRCHPSQRSRRLKVKYKLSKIHQPRTVHGFWYEQKVKSQNVTCVCVYIYLYRLSII